MRRRNRGRRKRGRINRRYLDSFKPTRYQGFESNYLPIPESSSSSLFTSNNSQLIKTLTTRIKPPAQFPIVDLNLCEGCGICAQNCPVGAIRIITEKAHIESKICTRCGICARICPRNAISII